METTSNQEDIHKNLEPTINRHLKSTYKKPVAVHNEKEFKNILNIIKNTKFILDTGCGTGLSSEYLSNKYPEHHILGLDKSVNRLDKTEAQNKNLSFHRIDLIDFFLLADKANLKSEITYFLYPNPWPKSEHFKRRWHGHPIFSKILKTSKKIILRTDWRIYIEEFRKALEIHRYKHEEISKLELNYGISRFEQKFIKQERNLYELIANE